MQEHLSKNDVQQEQQAMLLLVFDLAKVPVIWHKRIYELEPDRF